MKIIKQNSKTVFKAVSALKAGKVVICRTDTVYGFLADATNKKAVEKIYKIKKRLKSKPLPIFVNNIFMAKKLAEIDKKRIKIIKKYWPGKYTFVLNSKIKDRNLKLYGVNKKTIAIRIPKYSFLNKVLKKINKPLAQTSVNISGEKTLLNAKDIINIFKNEDLLFINGGDIVNSKPSKIIDLTGDNKKLLRK